MRVLPVDILLLLAVKIARISGFRKSIYQNAGIGKTDGSEQAPWIFDPPAGAVPGRQAISTA
jgi:hypothetical protein